MIVTNSVDAERLASDLLGVSYRLEECEKLPEVCCYFYSALELHSRFFAFAVLDVLPWRVGATRYVGVEKATGEVHELGQSGE